MLTPLAKSVLILLRWTAAASARDAAIKKTYVSDMITLIFSNEEMENITS